MTDVGTTMKSNPLTREKLMECFLYNEESGLFTLRDSRGKWKAGRVCGHKDTNGHIQLSIEGRPYLAHRCAWLWFYGEWPKTDIDHINGDRADNRLLNLRLASRSQNCCNSKKRVDNTTGFKGVSLHNGRYKAQIQVGRNKQHIGVYSTPEEAHKAYCEAAQALHGDFARTA